jgi:hypothetical protein
LTTNKAASLPGVLLGRKHYSSDVFLPADAYLDISDCSGDMGRIPDAELVVSSSKVCVRLLLLDGFGRIFILIPIDGVFDRFDLAVLPCCHTKDGCLVGCLLYLGNAYTCVL